MHKSYLKTKLFYFMSKDLTIYQVNGSGKFATNDGGMMLKTSYLEPLIQSWKIYP